MNVIVDLDAPEDVLRKQMAAAKRLIEKSVPSNWSPKPPFGSPQVYMGPESPHEPPPPDPSRVPAGLVWWLGRR